LLIRNTGKIPIKKGLFMLTQHNKKCYRRSAFIAGVSPFRHLLGVCFSWQRIPKSHQPSPKFMQRSSNAPGLFSIPGLLKMRVVKKPARKARKGVNPFTGEEMMFKAKPATKVVKVSALKGLKDMV
jgi:hypothetical protein